MACKKASLTVRLNKWGLFLAVPSKTVVSKKANYVIKNSQVRRNDVDQQAKISGQKRLMSRIGLVVFSNKHPLLWGATRFLFFPGTVDVSE
jgi:hypothetical protein